MQGAINCSLGLRRAPHGTIQRGPNSLDMTSILPHNMGFEICQLGFERCGNRTHMGRCRRVAVTFVSGFIRNAQN